AQTARLRGGTNRISEHSGREDPRMPYLLPVPIGVSASDTAAGEVAEQIASVDEFRHPCRVVPRSIIGARRAADGASLVAPIAQRAEQVPADEPGCAGDDGDRRMGARHRGTLGNRVLDHARTVTPLKGSLSAARPPFCSAISVAGRAPTEMNTAALQCGQWSCGGAHVVGVGFGFARRFWSGLELYLVAPPGTWFEEQGFCR